MPDSFETTDDGFLGGRLMLRQPKRGHRAGHDATLLAASTRAASGQRVIDLGAGVGAAGLALAARVSGLALTLLEINPVLSALAAFNAETNDLPARVVTADVADTTDLGAFDAVLMNPPFHDAARHRASPDDARRTAHLASDETLGIWLAAAHRLLGPQGSVTMIWRADGLAEVLAALKPRFGSIELQPVHPSKDKPAIRLLVRAKKAGRTPLRLHSSAMLDGRDARVEAAMRGEGHLPLADE